VDQLPQVDFDLAEYPGDARQDFSRPSGVVGRLAIAGQAVCMPLFYGWGGLDPDPAGYFARLQLDIVQQPFVASGLSLRELGLPKIVIIIAPFRTVGFSELCPARQAFELGEHRDGEPTGTGPGDAEEGER
jgi:hypothetical protein